MTLVPLPTHWPKLTTWLDPTPKNLRPPEAVPHDQGGRKKKKNTFGKNLIKSAIRERHPPLVILVSIILEVLANARRIKG